jgi:LytS/YehU family sensor histidine kinase
VPLADELEALARHLTLADIRYAGGVRLDVEVGAADADALLLPPVSLGELLQNALKHNVAGPGAPLSIRVRVEGESLIFENDVRSSPKPVRSTGIGLANLRERFRLATGREAAWALEQDRFVVRLPLVRRAVARQP